MLKIDTQFIKFLIVGVINTIFGYGIFSVIVFFGIHYSIASLIATCLGVLFNFKTTGIVVFQNNNNTYLIKFILVYVIVYLLNILLLSILNRFTSVYISAAMLLLPLAIISYFLNKTFVFRGKNENY